MAELAEALAHVVGFEVNALDLVIGTAALDGGPVYDVSRGCAHGIAHVGLLEDFFGAGASAAVGQELLRGELGTLGAVDDINDAEFDRVFYGDAEVEVPGGIFDF